MTHPALKTALKLSAKVAIYVPGTCGVDIAADNTAVVEKVAAALSTMFGGATAQKAEGFWCSDVAGLVKENTTIVYAFCSPADLEQHISDVVTIAQEIKHDLQQEAVSVELDGTLYII